MQRNGAFSHPLSNNDSSCLPRPTARRTSTGGSPALRYNEGLVYRPLEAVSEQPLSSAARTRTPYPTATVAFVPQSRAFCRRPRPAARRRTRRYPNCWVTPLPSCRTIGTTNFGKSGVVFFTVQDPHITERDGVNVVPHSPPPLLSPAAGADRPPGRGARPPCKPTAAPCHPPTPTQYPFDSPYTRAAPDLAATPAAVLWSPGRPVADGRLLRSDAADNTESFQYDRPATTVATPLREVCCAGRAAVVCQGFSPTGDRLPRSLGLAAPLTERPTCLTNPPRLPAAPCGSGTRRTPGPPRCFLHGVRLGSTIDPTQHQISPATSTSCSPGAANYGTSQPHQGVHPRRRAAHGGGEFDVRDKMEFVICGLPALQFAVSTTLNAWLEAAAKRPRVDFFWDMKPGRLVHIKSSSAARSQTGEGGA